MHYNKRYENEDEGKNDVQAIKDIKEYVGSLKRFKAMEASLKEEIVKGMTLDQMRIACSFAGIEGFPVSAWYRRLTA